MLEIWKTWFGQTLTLPVIAIFLTYLAAGILLGLKMKKKKTRLMILSAFAAFCAVCALCMLIESEMINVYAIYLGGMFTLLFAGSLIGIIYKKIRRCEK